MSYNGEELHLEVPIMYRAMFAEGHDDRKFFEQLLKQGLNKSIRLRIHTGGMVPGEEGESGSSDQQRLRLYKQAQRHPMLQMLLDTFDADIVAREPSARESWLKQFEQDQN